MNGRSVTIQAYVDARLDDALSHAGLANEHPIRAVLDEEAAVVGVREPAVRCREKSLQERIEELRSDPRFAGTFPSPKPTISKQDTASLRSQFHRVAKGDVVVQ